LHSTFEFWSSEDEGEEEDDDFGSPCKPGWSTLKYAQPAFHHKRSPSEHSDEDSSSGSGGGEEYSSIQVDESSSDEEERLRLERDESWLMLSTGGINYTISSR